MTSKSTINLNGDAYAIHMSFHQHIPMSEQHNVKRLKWKMALLHKFPAHLIRHNSESIIVPDFFLMDIVALQYGNPHINFSFVALGGSSKILLFDI